MKKTISIILSLLFITFTQLLFAAEAQYLEFSIKGNNGDKTTAFNNAVVKSNDAHWGWTKKWWTETHKTTRLGIPYDYVWTLHQELQNDGIVLGGKCTNTNKTFHTATNDDGNSISWDDKYVIIESKEAVKTIHLTADVYNSTATPPILKSYWYVYLTNDLNNWGDAIYDSGLSKSINKTIDVTGLDNYESIKLNKYVVLCYRGNFSAYISELTITDNTYLNVTSTPDDYVCYIGEYQSQDIVIEHCNLDGITNTGITDLTVTSSNPAFECTTQSGDDLGLLKTGTRNVTIRFNPTDSIPQTYEATITITGGTGISSLQKKVTVIGHSYKPQNIIWDQQFSRLDLSDADITLTAKSNLGLTPITYTSNDENVVKIVDGKLHIVGKGRTLITASQAGTDIYSPASKTKYVYVSEAGDPCEAYDLYEPGRVTLHTIDAEIYELFGMPADKLTFEACCTVDAISYFYVAQSIDGGKHFHDIQQLTDVPHMEFSLVELVYLFPGKWKTYTIQLDERATHVMIYTKPGSTMRHHIQNVKVTQKSYIRPTVSSINISPEIGSVNYSTTLRIAYSALEGNMNLAFKTETSQFSLNHTEIPVSCGDADTVNVTVSMPNVPCTNEIYNSILITNGSNSAEVPVIVKPTKGFQLINWFTKPTDVNTSSELTIADMGAYVAPRNNQPTYTSDNPEIADFDDAGNLVIKQPGNVTIRASKAEDECYAAAEDVTKTITIAQDYLTFDDKDKDKDWFNANNWKPNRTHIPNHLAIASLEADAEIDGTKIAYSKELTLDNHKVEIKADGALHAESILGANTATPLIQLAAGNSTQAPATLATKSTDVKANVGIFVEGSAKTKPATWQYFGIPFSIPSTPAFYNAWVCEWSEPQGNWTYKRVGEQLYPWTGYCITQPEETETYGYAIDGTIQTGDHTYELSFTKGANYEGDNIVTNSYTAPIDITKLKETDFVNTEHAIYIYNTGTYAQWESHKDSKVAKGALAGQYLAIPINVADYAPYDLTVIPQMQAFYLAATSENASFTVNYDRVVWNTTATAKPKRLPRRNTESETYNHDENLIIDISGSRFADAISVLKRSNCSSEYDDGYDAYKWEGNSLAPQLFSTEDDNNIYSVDTRETLEGHYLGFNPGEDNYYTITFRLVETDDLYYLKDLSDNSFYPIVEDMSITVEAGSANNHRFQIVSEIDYGEEPDKHQGVATDIALNSQTAYLTNSSDQTITANIYDMTGKVVQQQAIAPKSTFNYQLDHLPRGTYIISLGSKNQKIVR